jgi:hypothetical protein
MSIQQKPVKSSRFFLGHIHDVNVERLAGYFNVDNNAYKTLDMDEEILDKCMKGGKRVFFGGGMPEDYIDRTADLGRFNSFTEAYHQFITDLTNLTADSIDLVITPEDQTQNLYVTGGFAKNPLFTTILASRFHGKKTYTSEVANATSLGAAIVLWRCFGLEGEPELDLGLQLIPGFR